MRCAFRMRDLILIAMWMQKVWQKKGREYMRLSEWVIKNDEETQEALFLFDLRYLYVSMRCFCYSQFELTENEPLIE